MTKFCTKKQKQSCLATAIQGTKGSSYSLLTLTLGGVSGQSQAPAAICPEKEPQYPLVNLTSELVCTQRLEEKSSASARDRTSVAQSSIL
jgi:hypothetical protein